ncbi:hypothetical protein P7C71_g4618, partial [Lecanoromycetidae sp. Uapishka_2]
MHDSPPKRVTRARGKATDDEGLKLVTTRIMTASAKIAADKKKAAPPVKASAPKTKAIEKKNMAVENAADERPKEEPSKTTTRQKKPPVPARPSKRKTRADDDTEANENEVADEDPAVEVQPKPEPVKAKGRQKKATTANNNIVDQVDEPKPRGRQPKVAVMEEAPKTRGRPRKAAEPVPEVVHPEEPVEETAPVKKSTRGRAAATTSKRTTNTASRSVPKSTSAPKKQVKFEEEPDKENVPIETLVPKKSAMKPTGMKARPVRKPAVTRGSTRGKKATQESVQTAPMGEKTVSMPLSPKKDKQIAKSDPASSEDELCGAKTPVRALSKSPAKRAMSPIKGFGSVSKLNFDHISVPSSPAKTMSASVLASPARRPPTSPFKDALKDSPKKVNLGCSIAQPALLSSQVPTKVSLLQESPKRAKLGDKTVTSIFPASISPFKASLLQSPARRPMASPKKDAFLGSPDKAARATMIFEAVSPEPIIDPEGSPDEGEIVPSTIEEFTVESIDNDAPLFQAGSPEQREVAIKTPVMLGPLHDEVAAPEDAMEIDQTVPREDETSGLAVSPEFPATFTAPAFKFASSALRRVSIESESEDELASPQKGFGNTPLRSLGTSSNDFATPAVLEVQAAQQPSNANFFFTPLVDQLGSWAASSPNKIISTKRPRQARGIFSLGGPVTPAESETIDHGLADESPAKSSFFDDEMVMIDGQEDSVLVGSVPDPTLERERDFSVFQISQESQASEDYGDENVVPNELEIIRAEQDAQDPTLTCTPAKVFTPARAVPREQRVFHTVSKVPLRASAEDTPLKVPRQRSRSFGGPLAVIQSSKAPRHIEDQTDIGEQPATPVLSATAVSQTPSSAMRLDAETPGRTVRKGIVPDVLKGAVVYVDVHTTEGADASGIFIELLTQMGARCVKQWNWNPRASMGRSLDSDASPQVKSPDTSKVGITHVVYKDGGKRTLEKVRSSNGVVLCVGVGWVLDCEREDKWLDESDYAIDTSNVPRGGSRRRKSMEPRALANLNGNLVPASQDAPAKATMSPTKEFLTFNTPASRRETFIIEPQQPEKEVMEGKEPAPSTPHVTFAADDDNMLENGSAWGSPTTPYYLSKGAELVQRTCPPKQMHAIDDLGVLYAKNMDHFGCGMAMFQPVAAHDMRPPCVGYIDGNNRYESLRGTFSSELRLTNLEADSTLRRNVGLPVGADAHIKYKSNNSFGAVLMAQKPITLISYNDETLFNSWLRANRARLSLLHGHQLRRYGLWLVTRTYTTPRASITAWDAKDKEANMSVKAKANMMGELGGDLEWTDKSTDKDWSHYSGKADGGTVVVFFDGIEVPSYKWWWENLKVSAKVGEARRRELESSLHRQQSNKRQADAALGKDHSQARPHSERPHSARPLSERQQFGRPHSETPLIRRPPTEEDDLLAEDLWGSDTPLRGASPADGRSLSRGRQTQPRRAESANRSVSTPTRLSKYLNYEQEPVQLSQSGGASPPYPKGKVVPVAQRFSTASTATTSTTKDFETSPPIELLRGALHRKTASPSLRQVS